MENILELVQRARRRLTLQRFLSVAGNTCFYCLLVAAALLILDKRLHWGLNVFSWQGDEESSLLPGWLTGTLLFGGAAVVIGIFLAAVIAWWKAPRQLDAAIEIDRRFKLHERISSVLGMTDQERQSGFGQALLQDACDKSKPLELPSEFKLKLERRSWLSAAALGGLVLMAVLVPVSRTKGVTSQAKEQVKNDVKKAAAALREKLIQRRKEAREKKSESTEQLMDLVQKRAEELAKAPPAEKKEAIIKLNQLAKEINQNKNKLEAVEKLRQQLSQLAKVQQGPASKIAEALQVGKFQQAAEEMKKLQEKLKDSKLGDEEKEQLKKQLDEMAAQLKKAADANRELQQKLKNQIAQERAKGNAKQAQDLENKLEQAMKDSAKSQGLSNLASKLKQAQEALEQGKEQGAAQALQDAMDEMQKQLEDGDGLKGLEQQLNEAKDLEQLLEDIAMAKADMGQNGQQGDGEGKGRDGKGQGFDGQGEGDGNQKGGEGLGKGRGTGTRPISKENVGKYESNVRQKIGKGGSTIGGQGEGSSTPGFVTEQIQTEFEDVKQGNLDPLEGVKLPKNLQEHAREFFDAVRKGD